MLADRVSRSFIFEAPLKVNDIQPFRKRERIFLKQKAWGIHHADRNKLTILGERHIAAYPVPQVFFTLGHNMVITEDKRYDMQIDPVTII